MAGPREESSELDKILSGLSAEFDDFLMSPTYQAVRQNWLTFIRTSITGTRRPLTAADIDFDASTLKVLRLDQLNALLGREPLR